MDLIITDLSWNRMRATKYIKVMQDLLFSSLHRVAYPSIHLSIHHPCINPSIHLFIIYTAYICQGKREVVFRREGDTPCVSHQSIVGLTQEHPLCQIHHLNAPLSLLLFQLHTTVHSACQVPIVYFQILTFTFFFFLSSEK